MVRVCSVSVRRRRQMESDRSSPPAADVGRRVWGWVQPRASASLHLSGAQATSPSPSSSCTRSSGDGGGGCLSVAAGQGSIPRLPCRSMSFPSSKQQSPPGDRLAPIRHPCSSGSMLADPLPLLPLLSTNDLNCNLIMSHECFDRRCRQLVA
jgi:hypothetical protein